MSETINSSNNEDTYGVEPPSIQAGSQEERLITEKLLEDLIEMVNNGRSSIRSGNVSVNREEMLRLLNEVKEKFPEEIKAAKWLLNERKIFIDKVQQEKSEIMEEAQKRSSELVNRVGVVREAQRQASHIVQEAQEEASRMKHEIDTYCVNQLAKFEDVLAKVYEEIQQGKAKLQEKESLRGIESQAELNFDQPVQELEEQDSTVPENYSSPNNSEKVLVEEEPYLDPLI